MGFAHGTLLFLHYDICRYKTCRKKRNILSLSHEVLLFRLKSSTNTGKIRYRNIKYLSYISSIGMFIEYIPRKMQVVCACLCYVVFSSTMSLDTEHFLLQRGHRRSLPMLYMGRERRWSRRINWRSASSDWAFIPISFISHRTTYITVTS